MAVVTYQWIVCMHIPSNYNGSTTSSGRQQMEITHQSTFNSNLIYFICLLSIHHEDLETNIDSSIIIIIIEQLLITVSDSNSCLGNALWGALSYVMPVFALLNVVVVSESKCSGWSSNVRCPWCQSQSIAMLSAESVFFLTMPTFP